MKQAEGPGGLRDIIRLGLVLALFTALAGAALAQTHGVTQPVIQQREAKALMESLQAGLPEADDFESSEVDGVTFYEGMKDGDLIGVIALTEGSGYGGPVTLMVVMNPEGEIGSVRILGLSETPGIGTKVTDEGFLAQYTGKTPGDPISIGRDIEAVSGATVSSRAVTAGVQAVASSFASVYLGQ